MKIDNPTGDPDCHKDQYDVRLKERRVEDLHFAQPREAFERVREVSEVNESVYAGRVSPWVRATANPWMAEALKWLHPMRTGRYMVSDSFNPWMRGVAMLATAVAKDREPLPADHPMMRREREAIALVGLAVETMREARDVAIEGMFGLLYGLPGNKGQ